jgi:ribose transport system substrate-binding protein
MFHQNFVSNAHLSVRFVARLLAAFAACLCFGTAHAQQDRLIGLVEPLVAQKPFKIGVTLVHLNDDFWKGIAYGMVDEAKRSNVKIVQISVAGAYGNVREQFAQLTTLKSLGVDYIALGAASFNGYDPVIKQMKDAGIKVVAAGIPVNSANVAFGVTQDDSAIGRVLAAAICRKNSKGKVITVPGPAGAEWVRLRYVGFMDEVKKCDGLTAYEGAFGGPLGLQQGLAQTSDLLLKHPEANFVYTPEISLGMGAAQAVRQMKRNVQVVSSSMVKEAMPMVSDGRLLAVVSEPGIIMGRLIVQYAIRDREGKSLPKMISDKGSPYPYVLTPPTLITPENVKTFPLDIYEIPPADFRIDALQ